MYNQSNILNNLTFMYKVKSETALAGFPKPAHQYSTNFTKLNYIKPTSKQIKIQNIWQRSALWAQFLKDSEKEIENLSIFKSEVKCKLLSYENKLISPNQLYVHYQTNIYQR